MIPHIFHQWKQLQRDDGDDVAVCHHCRMVRSRRRNHHNSTFYSYTYSRPNGDIISKSWVPSCRNKLELVE